MSGLFCSPGCGNISAIDSTSKTASTGVVVNALGDTHSQWKPSVFISDPYVNQYAPRNHGKLRQTIEYHAGTAHGLAEDNSGNLWVASIAQEGVYEFAPNSSRPIRSIPQSLLQEWPVGVAICPDGEIYVSDELSEQPPRLGAVFVYDYNSLYQLAEPTPSDLDQGGFVQCDAHSNVYLDYSDKSGIVRFVTTPAGSYGAWQPMPMKLDGVIDFKIMRSGDVVVPADSEVDFYHPKAKTPYRTIGGFSGASALAFRQDEKTLWVLDTPLEKVFEIDVATGAIIGALTKAFPAGAVDVLAVPADQR
ncbi:MAG: hypothetical protein WBW89_00065 [Candidatus Cybelea sp.]